MKNLLSIQGAFLLVCYSLVTIYAIFFDKAYLEFMLPVTLFLLLINYFLESKNINTFFVIAVTSLMISDYLIYTDMITNFNMICATMFMYLVASCFTLKDYFNQIKIHWTKLISAPLLISLALIIFLIISISDLVLYLLPGSTPYIIITVVPLLIYVAISYYIYVSDLYKSGIKLLFSACLCILTVALCPINELFYPTPIFTFFVTSAHIGGIYVFMQFLTRTAPISNPIPEIPKFI